MSHRIKRCRSDQAHEAHVWFSVNDSFACPGRAITNPTINNALVFRKGSQPGGDAA